MQTQAKYFTMPQGKSRFGGTVYFFLGALLKKSENVAYTDAQLCKFCNNLCHLAYQVF